MSKKANGLEDFLTSPASYDHVMLPYKNITDDDCIRLAGGLKLNKAITHIDLDHNKIGNKGALAILEGLKGNSKLYQLYLDNNQIGPDMVSQIKHSLQHIKIFSIHNQKPVIVKKEKKEEKTEIISDDYVASEAKHVLSKESRLKESLAKAHDEIGLLQVRSDSTTVTELMTIPTNEEEIETEVTGDGSW